MKQSKEIIQFYRELDSWIKGGCLSHFIFETYRGLCNNLFMHNFHKYDELLSDSLETELSGQFISAGLGANYPFGMQDYDTRSGNDTMYECPKRLAWIADRLRDAEEQERNTQ